MKLKPCPFCGNDPQLVSYYIGGTANRLNYFYKCNSCGIRLRNRKSPEGAKDDWNKRFHCIKDVPDDNI